MKPLSIFSLGIFISLRAFCQDPEFPAKEFIVHIRLQSGLVTNFHKNVPDVYVGQLQIIPQYTFIANKLRAGVIAGGYFTNKKLGGIIGPVVSYKIKTLSAGLFGSGGNLNISLEQLFGTDRQLLFGGGVNADIANKIVLNISAHRDYRLNNWWFQSGFAIRISKVKQPPHP